MTGGSGSATVVMSAVIGLVAVLAVAVAGLAMLYAARTQAQTAADASALAAAVATYPPAAEMTPIGAARLAASSNGASIVRCECPVDPALGTRTVTVTAGIRAEVPVFGSFLVRARSSAEFDPRRWLGW